MLGILTTKAKPVSVGKERERLPKDMLWVMGVPVFKHPICPFFNVFDTLCDTEIVQLAGKIMPLSVIDISLGFCLAHIKVLAGQRLSMTTVWHDSC